MRTCKCVHDKLSSIYTLYNYTIVYTNMAAVTKFVAEDNKTTRPTSASKTTWHFGDLMHTSFVYTVCAAHLHDVSKSGFLNQISPYTHLAMDFSVTAADRHIFGSAHGHQETDWLRDAPSVFSARCNIYISRLCYDVSVRLPVRLSVCDGSALAPYS